MPRRPLVPAGFAVSAAFAATLALAAVFAFAACPARAEEDGKDIRDLAIGMSVAELPQAGYVELICAGVPDTQLDSWEGYEKCPANDKGQREVRFQFDDASLQAQYNERYKGTKIGGHPVLISILISKARTVDGILIETDPKVRLFLKKKAFLMALQIRERYGNDGWTCADQPKGAGEEPVGGAFIKERCEKVTATRRYVYDRELFQRAGQSLKDFVSTTRLAILAKG